MLKKWNKKIVALLILAMLVTSIPIYAKEVDVNFSIGYVNYTYLNLREEPTTASNIQVKLSKNDKLNLLRYDNDGWYKVTAHHENAVYTGWVAEQYVDIQYVYSYGGYAKVTKTIPLRDTSRKYYYNVIGTIPVNSVVKTVGFEEDRDLAVVEFEGKRGWIESIYLDNRSLPMPTVTPTPKPTATPTPVIQPYEKIGVVGTTNLNLYYLPNKKDVACTVSEGTPIHIKGLSDDDKWYNVAVRIGGKKYSGFVEEKYVMEVSKLPQSISTVDTVDLWKYSTCTTSLGKISKGISIKPTSIIGGSYKVTTTINGTQKTGYIDCIDVVSNSTSKPTATPTPKPTATPTPKPTATPTPKPTTSSSKYGYVNTNTLKMRSKPTSSSAVLSVKLLKNDPVEILGKEGNYYKVNAYSVLNHTVYENVYVSASSTYIKISKKVTN